MLGRTLGFGLALAGLTIAACSATSNDSKGGGGGTSTGGASASGGFGGTSASGGTGGGSATGGVSIDAGTGATGGAPSDAGCTTTTDKAGKPAVDIIWLVDNSCSMADEIQKVRDNINSSFVPIIEQSNIDWQVIMISARGTSDQQVCVEPPLAGPACGNNKPKFTHLNCEVDSTNSLYAAAFAYQGGGFPPILCDLTGGPLNALARFDATKVFVEVTDDEAEFFGWNAATFDNWALTQALPAGMFGTAAARKYIFHSIIGADPVDLTKTCSSVGVDAGADAGPGNSAVNPGFEYQKLSQLTGGVVRSICEDDWSDIFNTIATGIVDKLSCEYAVPAPADGGTIDPTKVNVTFTPSSDAGAGTPEDILQDNNSGCDAGADGWQWDAAKTKILLCGPTCEKVKADEGGQIDIVVGCETKVVPPPQ
jgi:hypothetical protein